jgi:hypothetical protein
MKTPRVTDFDPDAKLLTLKSSLDNMPSIQKPSASHTFQPSPSLKHSASPSSTDVIKLAPAPAAPPPSLRNSQRRSFLRRTFDFYEDQIAFLKRESLEQRLAGQERGMNEMVREAIDDWINKKTLRK